MVKAKKLKWRERKAKRNRAIPSTPVAQAVAMRDWVKASWTLQLFQTGQVSVYGRWGGLARRSPLWPHHLLQGNWIPMGKCTQQNALGGHWSWCSWKLKNTDGSN